MLRWPRSAAPVRAIRSAVRASSRRSLAPGLRHLPLDEVGKQAVDAHQLREAPALDDLPAVHDVNPVGADDRAETMRDHHAARLQTLQAVAHEALGAVVERT